MKAKSLFLFSASFFIALSILFTMHLTVVHAASYYTVTPKVTEAVEDYLNEIYIDKYPEMGLEFTSGTERDKKVLMILADTITADCNTDTEKAMAITKWVDRNISYESLTGETWYLAVDVFHERVGNCVGTAQLISQLMRLEGIPALMCSGQRGDMVNVLKIEEPLPVGHSWVMAYVDGAWQLYDPLFDEYALTDKDYISKWYFTDDMEGISPYYEGMDTTLMYDGHALYYINGRFMNYDGGVPASEHEGCGVLGGKDINLAVSYFAESLYLEDGESRDGFYYVSNPERKNSMINDECFTDGWINYDGLHYSLARPNGTLVSNTVRELNGDYYYLGLGGWALRMEENPENRTLTRGMITIHPGESIRFDPTFIESEVAKGRVIYWENLNPEVASITQDGVITAKTEGFADFRVYSKDTIDGDTHYGGAAIQLMVKGTDYRTAPDYSDRPINDDTCEHVWDKGVVIKEPSCTEVGVMTYTCRNDCCNETKTEDIPITGHNYSKTYTVDKAATMKKNGSKSKHCTRSGCSAKKSVTAIPKISTVKLSASTLVYNGKSKVPSVLVKDSKGNKLIKGTDYTVKTPAGRKNAGTYKYKITFKGKYFGTKELKLTIKPKKISKLTLSKVAYVYDGNAKKPTATVKAGTMTPASKRLKGNDNVTITYAKGRTKVGTYKVTVKGKGNYTGTLTKTFKIKPKATKITSVSKGKKSFTVKWSKRKKQTTGYQIYYTTSKTMKNGTKVTISKNTTTKKTIKNLKAKKKYYVWVRTYKTVNGTKYYSAWSTRSAVTTK